MKLSETVKEKFELHALKEYPKECCGLLINDEYVEMENFADYPEENFCIDPKSSFMDYQAVLHSHTFKQGEPLKVLPGESDIEGRILTDVPWFIISTNGEDISNIIGFGDFILDEPLYDRDFIHGVYDCYSAVRSYFWQEYNIKLRDYPRNDLWWRKEKDLYEANFEKEGFYEIPIEDLKPGDCVLMNILSDKINHSAVYLGNNLIYHHLYNRKSRKDLLSNWRSKIVKAVRLKRC